MERSTNQNLISDYLQYCREHQNIIYSALNDLRIINLRMSDFIMMQLNSRDRNELVELSRTLDRLNNEITQQTSTQRNESTNTQQTRNPAPQETSNRRATTLSSLTRPNEIPPPPPLPPPPPSQTSQRRSNIPPPPPPPPPSSTRRTPSTVTRTPPPPRQQARNRIDELPLPGAISYPSIDEMNTESSGNRRENTRINTISSEERQITPLTSSILRTPIGRTTSSSNESIRSSNQSPLNYRRGNTSRTRNRNRIRNTNTRIPRSSNRFDRIFTFTNPTRMPVNTFSELSPVRIRPSISQIRRGTELLVWSDISDNYQTHCPIDMEDFSGNDSILRIRHCGHIFREMNLRRHFRNSTRCPICRFDIREYITPENSYLPESNTESSSSNTTNDTIENTAIQRRYLSSSIFNSIDSDILDVIEEAVNHASMDSSSNIITADITYQLR